MSWYIGMFFLAALGLAGTFVCAFLLARRNRARQRAEAGRLHQTIADVVHSLHDRSGRRERIQPWTTAGCPECGAPLPDDAPEGLCPRCLLQSAQSASPLPDGGGSSPFTAPEPSELAVHFPQLEILSLLGQGGMGAVYKARQLELDRLVALKVLPLEWGRDPAFAERFQREARALARLNHPHIVAVHESGEAGGHFYLLMEYVDGANLRRLLQAGPLDPQLALQVIPQICDALQYAHEEGVVHRDIKPENILLDTKGRVTIADFGLAKLVGPSRASFTLTGTHQVMGTLDYMAPEQRTRPQDVDHRADVYSLGVVFYELLTGELPLGRFAPPSQASGVDGRIDEVVFRALERDPDRRFQRVSELRDELEAITGGVTAPGPAAAPHASAAKHVQLQVRGPATALFLTALVAAVECVVAACAFTMAYEDPNQIPYAAALFWTCIAAVVCALVWAIIFGSIKLRRFQGYEFVVMATILAALPWSAHCLIGIPAGIWTIWTLSRPEVRAAFAANLGLRPKPAPEPPPPTGPIPRWARSFWRSLVSVFISTHRREEPPLPARPSTPR